MDGPEGVSEANHPATFRSRERHWAPAFAGATGYKRFHYGERRSVTPTHINQ
jgi:hypothetical protein